ncbi:MAG TPA: hypothetical protein VH877_01965 [Polyangia bacterium]|jgi:hypothetical protein|nr:hypothetical protein [Polyangia bacterium]
MKVKGTIQRSDLEGGFYTLSAGGETYKLEGGGADLHKVGTSVEVEGSVQKDAMGIGFGMPVLRVKSYRIL